MWNSGSVPFQQADNWTKGRKKKRGHKSWHKELGRRRRARSYTHIIPSPLRFRGLIAAKSLVEQRNRNLRVQLAELAAATCNVSGSTIDNNFLNEQELTLWKGFLRVSKPREMKISIRPWVENEKNLSETLTVRVYHKSNLFKLDLLNPIEFKSMKNMLLPVDSPKKCHVVRTQWNFAKQACWIGFHVECSVTDSTCQKGKITQGESKQGGLQRSKVIIALLDVWILWHLGVSISSSTPCGSVIL